MNKNALKKASSRKVVTQTGQLPSSSGFDGRGGGVIRSLTKDEVRIQKEYFDSFLTK